MKSRWEQQGIPNPGSARALDHGCMCAVLDNHHGQGFVMNHERCFWITMGCPLHAPVEDTVESL
jgi:hypothetical protein